jgi:DNA-binding NarL/FixJ family response regulator
MINVMIVDDHQVVRQGLRALLDTEPDLHVVGEASDGIEAMTLAEELHPDIIIIDLVMNGISGIETTRQLSKTFSGTGIVIFSMLATEYYVLEALRAGARGYISKDSSPEELIRAVREVAAGHHLLISSVLDRTINFFLRMADSNDNDPLQKLTAREREVLYLSAQQKTCPEIAKTLFVSPRTVEAQRTSIMRKLGLKNQRELIGFAFEKGILVPEP